VKLLELVLVLRSVENAHSSSGLAMIRIGLAGLLLIGLTGCGDPTIDTSTDAAMEESVAEVRESLDPEMRARFDTAMMTVGMSGVSLETLMAGETGAASLASQIKGKLEGRTGEEVIQMADSIRAAEEAERRRQAQQEIAELEERKKRAETAEAKLSDFEIQRSRFEMRESYFGTEEPIIELTVRNGLDVAVSRAYFTGTLQSEGRSVPWIQEDFNYQISGGLEPGETATWRLAPNQFGPWGQVDAPSDAVLTVRVKRLDGPDGEPLFGGDRWGSDDQERLDELRAQYSD
jgi:hypothetical protein